MTDDAALRRRVLRDPVAYFKEWARIGQRNGMLDTLQLRRLGPFSSFTLSTWVLMNRPHVDYMGRMEYVTIREEIAEFKRREALGRATGGSEGADA